jgi:hypothetical protein
MDVEFGNVNGLDTQGTGWFLGFSDWTRPSGDQPAGLRHVPADQSCSGLSMKWMRHPAGDPRGTAKPLSEGRTLSVMVEAGGRFRIQFCDDPAFPGASTREVLLSATGDYCAWGAGLHHRWFADQDSTILTLRWVPGTGQGSATGPGAAS